MPSPFGTGSIPGIAASTRLTCVFGSAPKAVAAPEKSLALETTWAWTSRPTTTSHSPVSPLIVNSALMFFFFADNDVGRNHHDEGENPAYRDRHQHSHVEIGIAADEE